MFSSVSLQELSQFANNLSVMLKSGMTIDASLASLESEVTSRHFKRVIKQLASDVQQGVLLATAFRKQKRAFGPVFVGLIAASEESGTLQENLSFLADWYERAADLEREVSAATLYPKIVFFSAMLLGGGLAVFILPRLTPLFSQLDVELPLITKVLLTVSVFIQEQWVFCIIGISALFFAGYFLLQVPVVRYIVDIVTLKLPLIGQVIKNYQLARIMQLFGTMLKSGLPLTQVVHIVENATDQTLYKHSIQAMQQKINVGHTLSEAMHDYPALYPKMCVGIVVVGERSGTLSDSFMYLAHYYTKEVKTYAKRLPTVLEPVLLIFIAFVVGLVALAIILPIYKLTGSIGR